MEPTTSGTVAATITAAIASGTTAAVVTGFVDSTSVAIFGVKAIVVIFAIIGAYVALAYSDPIRPLNRLIILFLANTLLGVVAAVAAPHVPGVEWLKPMPPQVISFVVAAVALWATPLVITWLRGWAVKRLPQPPAEGGGTEGVK